MTTATSKIQFDFERLKECIAKQNAKWDGFRTTTGDKRNDVSVEEFMFMHIDDNGIWFKHCVTRNYVCMQEFCGKYNLQIPRCDKAFMQGEF